MATVTGPPPRWPVGWMPAFHRDPLAALQRLQRAYGSPARLPIGPWQLIHLAQADEVRPLLEADPAAVHKGPGMDQANPLLGAGLLLANGAAWVEERRRLQPCLRWQALQPLTPAALAWTAQEVAAWPTNVAVQAEVATARLSLEWTTQVLFGGARLPQPAQTQAAIEGLLGFLFRRSRSFYRPPYHWRGFNRRYWRAETRLRQAVRALRAQSEGGVFACLGSQDRLDEAQAVTLLMAGQETTGLALAWALALVAHHPAVAAAVRQEALTNWNGSPDDYHPDRLPYTRAVFLEALRLYPPVWILSRTTRQELDLAGHRFAPGTHFLVSPWVIHRLPTVYPQPDRFAPERWVTVNPFRRHPYQYLPFGAGVRRCPGQTLAVFEGTAVLAHIFRRWGVEAAGPLPVPQPRLNLLPGGGVWLRWREPG